MILEILFITVLAIIIGTIIATILYKKGIKIETKEEKEKEKIINDPDLLLEKLNNNGKMVDSGEELKYSIVDNKGVKSLELKKLPIISDKGEKEKNKKEV